MKTRDPRREGDRLRVDRAPVGYTRPVNETLPLILTPKLDADSQAFFDAMRERHFPPGRNFIPAHVSLFNQLPGERRAGISSDLAEACRERKPFAITVEKLLFLGRGVAYELRSEKLDSLREELAREWKPWLGPQDRRGFRPHITVQNKVAPERAKSLHEELRGSFEPFEARAEGLLLWRYLGGPWEAAGEYPFVKPE